MKKGAEELQREVNELREALRIERARSAARMNLASNNDERGLYLAPARYIPSYKFKRRVSGEWQRVPTRAEVFAVCPCCLLVIQADGEEAERMEIGGKEGFYLYHKTCDAFAPVAHTEAKPAD